MPDQRDAIVDQGHLVAFREDEADTLADFLGEVVTPPPLPQVAVTATLEFAQQGVPPAAGDVGNNTCCIVRKSGPIHKVVKFAVGRIPFEAGFGDLFEGVAAQHRQHGPVSLGVAALGDVDAEVIEDAGLGRLPDFEQAAEGVFEAAGGRHVAVAGRNRVLDPSEFEIAEDAVRAHR